MWLSKQKLLPSKREKVIETKSGKIPKSYQSKVLVPSVRTKTNTQGDLLRKSQQTMILKRAMYSKFPSGFLSLEENADANNDGRDQHGERGTIQQQDQLKLDELEEEEFEGKVAITNWAMSRAQKIIRDISFESKTFDIYRPEFSSQGQCS